MFKNWPDFRFDSLVRSVSAIKIRFRCVLFAQAALALAVGSASAAPDIGGYTGKIVPKFHGARNTKLLYSQNSNSDGEYIDSQNFTSGAFASYTDSGADDFVVPKGQTWTITEVDVSGVYFGGSGPASSENVIFYKDRKSMPGKGVKGGTFNSLSCADFVGSFGCALGKGIELKAGHYWVAIVANCS